MNNKKRDTRWLASVALMMAVVILLANTPFGMIQLPVIKATTVHIPVILGAILLGPLAGAVLGATFDKQYHGSDPAVLCVLALHEYDRDSRHAEGCMGFRWMQDIDWRGRRMALDPV